MQTWQIAVIVIAIIGVIYLALFTAAGFGSAEASAGHFFGDVTKGTSLEQSADSVEAAGNSLTQTADNTIGEFTALLIIGALIVAVALDS
jgi:hypothetical protein